LQNFYIIGNSTTLNGLAAVVLFLAVVCALLSSRRSLPLVFIAAACSITIGQQLVVASLHFTIFRLIIVAAWIRLLLRGEARMGSWTTVDKALVAWVAIGTVAPILRIGSSEAFINAAGHAYDAIGLYFLFRFTVRTPDDVMLIVRAIAVMLILLVLPMTIERYLDVNIFSVFGGVPLHPLIRGGHLRAQGPFRHPILAGSFGATSLPLLAALWNSGKESDRRLSAVAFVSATIIVVLSESSGPVMTYIVALITILGWGFRKNVRELSYLFLLGLLGLMVMMKAPIWFVFSRVGDVLGGTGYHRSILIDAAIRHFGQWWKLGTSNTVDWLPYFLSLTDQADITNQFIAEGVNGGVFTLLAFVLMVAAAFRSSVAAAQDDRRSPGECRMGWGIWSSLLTHVVAFLSVTYFDQMQLFWYLVLACAAGLRGGTSRSVVPGFTTNQGMSPDKGLTLV
jgi:hypothetical protein